MKSYLADNKQLFNVKAIATAGKGIEELVEGEFGIIDDATGKTVVPANWSAVPETFSFVNILGGKPYYSFSGIEKAYVKNVAKVDYQAQQVNCWSTTFEHCKCIKGVKLVVNYSEAQLMQRDGFTWQHRDIDYVVSPDELRNCYCSCDGKYPVYENNVLTMLLLNKVNNSPDRLYKAFVTIAHDSTGASLPGSDQTKGDIHLKTGSTNPGLYVYDGTAWELIGDEDSIVTDVEAFVELMKPENTGDDPDDFGPLLTFSICGLEQPARLYRDIETQYIYPRGVRLTPALMIDGVIATTWTENQPLKYELGNGYDVRAEEWENMNYYSTINHRVQHHDGIQSDHLVYQFENGKLYNTINFEWTTEKTNTNDGDRRLFGAMLGIETTNTSVYTALKNMFGL